MPPCPSDPSLGEPLARGVINPKARGFECRPRPLQRTRNRGDGSAISVVQRPIARLISFDAAAVDALESLRDER